MILDSTSSTSTASTGSSTSSQAAADKQKLDGDLNRFLTLLVTQLQNQDPLQPMDANQFTSQLVQFASVEQQIYQNANLEKLLSAQRSAEMANMSGYLGNAVEASGNQLPLQNGAALASYTLPSNASEVTISVQDPLGKTVFATSGEKAAGRHEFTWDGKSTGGQQLPDGTYTLTVAGRDINGDSMSVTQTVIGTATAVANDENGTSVEMGDVQIPIENVLAVRPGQGTAAAGT